jgi:hypothetical protein
MPLAMVKNLFLTVKRKIHVTKKFALYKRVGIKKAAVIIFIVFSLHKRFVCA